MDYLCNMMQFMHIFFLINVCLSHDIVRGYNTIIVVDW